MNKKIKVLFIVLFITSFTLSNLTGFNVNVSASSQIDTTTNTEPVVVTDQNANDTQSDIPMQNAVTNPQQYTVTYNLGNSLESYSPVMVTEGELLTFPGYPTIAGGFFIGYYTVDGMYWDFETMTMPANDIELIAMYDMTKYIWVYFDGNGATEWIDIHSGMPENYMLSKPDTDPKKTGYEFMGWVTDEGLLWEFDTMSVGSENIHLSAVWQINSYTVTYDANGGEGVVDSQSVSYDNLITQPNTNPTKSGYQFTGWNTSADGMGTTWDFTTMTLTNDTVLYAQYAEFSDVTLTGTQINTVPKLAETGNDNSSLIMGVSLIIGAVALFFRKMMV